MTKDELIGYQEAKDNYSKGVLVDKHEFDLAIEGAAVTPEFKRGWNYFVRGIHKQSFKGVYKMSSPTQEAQRNYPADMTEEDIENYQNDMKDLFADEYDMWIDSIENQYRKDKQNGLAQE